MSDPRHTSPLIVAVHTVTFRQARNFVPAVLPVVAAAGLNGGRTTVAVLGVAVTLLSLGTATLSWWRFTYADGPGSVVITKGLLSRSVRTVPNDRIRGVEVEATPLHRVFGLVRVRIDAAAGVTDKHEELIVDGLSRAEGDRLRRAVLTHRQAPAPVPDGPREEEFGRFDNRWLLYAPLVGSYLALPLAALGALVRLAQELPDGLRPRLDDAEPVTVREIALAVGGAILLLLVGSVIGAAIVNWGFRLVRRGGSLIAVRGLITRRHTELEIDRIRGAAITEGLGMRLVRAARVSALVTGLGDATKRGQLLPLGPRSEAWRLAHRVVAEPGPLIAHPPAARRRRIVRATVGGLVVTLAGAVATVVAGAWWLLVAGLVLTAVGVPVGLGRYASLGHVAGPRSFSVRSGWLTREHAVLERRAVVGWRVRQSFFQRRAGVATVVACVGAGRGGYAAIDLAADDVAGFTLAASEPWAATFTAPGR